MVQVQPGITQNKRSSVRDTADGPINSCEIKKSHIRHTKSMEFIFHEGAFWFSTAVIQQFRVDSDPLKSLLQVNIWNL